MKKLLILAFVVMFCAAAGSEARAEATIASTQPAGSELLQSKAQMPGYGQEVYRIVSDRDEVISVLRNGATVICRRIPSPVAAVRGYVYTGGVYEGKWLGGGLSHLLEHLVAGGSSERRSEAENRTLLQHIGNDSNAGTTSDHTEYFVNTTTSHFAEAADLVTGWMLGAKITVPEYRREYQVVQRELERDKGNPDWAFFQLIQANRYKVNPARVPVVGYQEVIQGLSRDDVYSYYQMAYQPNNMVFSVASSMDPQEMLKVMQRNLAEYKPGRAFSRDIAPEPPVLAPRTVVATFPRLGQARLSIAFPSVKETDQDMFALDLLAQILGGGESSILVQQIRDSQQLCSVIGCGDETPSYADGSFEIFLELDAAQVPAATQAVLDQIEKIRKDGVDPARLQRAKAEMKIEHLKSLQTSEDVASALALDYMNTSDPHFSEQYVQRISEVSAGQIQEVARKYLDRGKLLTTLLLPREAVGAGGLPKAEDLLRGASTQPSQGGQSAEVADQTITRTVLDNGLVVLHKRLTAAPLVQISMYALGGVSVEDASNNGIGNLAMMLVRRGTDTHSADEISDFFDRTGGGLETSCGNNTWFWTVQCAKEDFPQTMQMYADVVNHPSFPKDQVSALKTRVLAAIASEDAAWDQQAFHYFKQQFFGPLGSAYQFKPIGDEKNVARFGGEDLKSWYFRKVLKQPRVIAVFGDIDRESAVAAVKQWFAQSGSAALPSPELNKQVHVSGAAADGHPTIHVDRVAVQKTDQELAGVIIGFKSGSVVGEPDSATLTLSQGLTGGYGYPTGYIFETLRGMGLVYEAATIDNPGRSAQLPGVFIAYAGCGPKNVNKVVDEILLNIARLQSSDADIQTDWFARCKNTINTFAALENETPTAQAAQAATDELFGLGYDYHTKFADRISAVQMDELRQIARTRLNHCVITVCTPAPQLVNEATGDRTYDSFPAVDLTPRGVQHDQSPAK